jgi:hypothetical protein
VIPHNASAPVQFGAAVLVDALKSKGLQVNVAGQSSRDVRYFWHLADVLLALRIHRADRCCGVGHCGC